MIRFGSLIPVTIYPAFWLMAAAIGWLNTASLAGILIWVVVVFVSVLIHELGHALTGLILGQRVSVDLLALGGVTKRGGTRRLSLPQEFLFVLNGPLAGLFLYSLAHYAQGFVTQSTGPLAYGLQVAVYVNLFWTLINLLPIQPLDGGKLFSILLEGMLGFRGVKLSFFFSIVLSGALALLCFAGRLILPGAFFMIFAFESYRTWKGMRALTVLDADQTLQQQVREAEVLLEKGHFSEAEQRLRLLRERAPSGVLHVAATELLASALASQGHMQEAYALLSPKRKLLSPPGLLLLQQLAYQQGEWRAAADLGKQVFELAPTAETALLNARCHARLGEVTPTLGWLRFAHKEGGVDLPQALRETDFESLQRDPDFKDFIHSL